MFIVLCFVFALVFFGISVAAIADPWRSRLISLGLACLALGEMIRALPLLKGGG